MSGHRYSFDKRIDVCKHELWELRNDYYDLAETNLDCLPATGLHRFGWPGALAALAISGKDRRAFRDGFEKQLAKWKEHQRRVDAFRRLLGTLEDDCPSGSSQALEVAKLLVGAAKLAHDVSEAVNPMVEASESFVEISKQRRRLSEIRRRQRSR